LNIVFPAKVLYNASLEATISIKNINLPKISNWKDSPTIGSSFPVKKNKNVTFSSKIHYVGYDWWLSKAKEHPLNATAIIKVKGSDDHVIVCAEVDLQFKFCIRKLPRNI